MDRCLSLLGMAKKAGLLAVGGEATVAAARRNTARLIITANDASDGSKRRARSIAEQNGIKYIAVPYTKFEIGSITGRGSPGTVAFLDKGLAKSFTDKLPLPEPKKESDAQ